MKHLAALLSLLIFAAGCSTQYREADPQVSSDELFSIIEEILSMGDSKVGALNFNVDELGQGSASMIYHSRDAEGKPAASVIAMADMSVFDSQLPVGVPALAIGMVKADAIFIDHVNERQERGFSLLLAWSEAMSGVETPHSFIGTSIPGSAQFSDTIFQVEMTGKSDEHLILRSDDLSEDYKNELGTSIKLKIYVVENGVEYYAGQISTMAGFGNRK